MPNDKSGSVRWMLIKKTFIFQIKLSLDAIRDLILSPVSIALTVIDLIFRHDKDKSYLFKLMHYGRLSDRWINLFDLEQHPLQTKRNNVDGWISKVESVLDEQKKSGNISNAAKDKIDSYLNKISLSNQEQKDRKN